MTDVLYTYMYLHLGQAERPGQHLGCALPAIDKYLMEQTSDDKGNGGSSEIRGGLMCTESAVARRAIRGGTDACVVA